MVSTFELKNEMVILLTGLLCGSLDVGAAVLLFVAQTKQNPALLLKLITSAAIGPRALQGGFDMVLLGLGFHYLIALLWTGLYFVSMPRLIPCGTMLTQATVYGLFVWVMMNLVVLPLSKAGPRPFSAGMALVNILILILTIGFPCAYLASRYPLVGIGL